MVVYWCERVWIQTQHVFHINSQIDFLSANNFRFLKTFNDTLMSPFACAKKILLLRKSFYENKLLHI